MNELRVLINTEKSYVVNVTKLWTHNNICDAFLSIKRYEMIMYENRNDMKKKRPIDVCEKKVNARKLHTVYDFNQMVTMRIK